VKEGRHKQNRPCVGEITYFGAKAEGVVECSRSYRPMSREVASWNTIKLYIYGLDC